MKKIITSCTLLLFVALLSSCKNEKSLQSYLVDTSGKDGFYTGDLPVSSMLTANADVSEDVKKTMESIKKINFVFLPKTEDNTATYETEKSKLKNIFKDNNDYKSLMSMKMKGMNVSIYFSGKTDAIDEVIAFGYGDQQGVGVARLLGDNMNPAQIIEMMNSVKMDANNDSFKNFANLFNQ